MPHSNGLRVLWGTCACWISLSAMYCTWLTMVYMLMHMMHMCRHFEIDDHVQEVRILLASLDGSGWIDLCSDPPIWMPSTLQPDASLTAQAATTGRAQLHRCAAQQPPFCADVDGMAGAVADLLVIPITTCPEGPLKHQLSKGKLGAAAHAADSETHVDKGWHPIAVVQVRRCVHRQAPSRRACVFPWFGAIKAGIACDERGCQLCGLMQ